MSRNVRVRLEIDPSCQETEIVIRTCQKSKEAEEIIRAVERCVGNEYPPVTAYKGDTLVLVTQNDIFRVYTESRKLIVCTGNDRYESRQPLKELEEQLDEGHFVRISRFEIINLRKVSGFDFSNTGTIRVIFTDGSETWVARRYVQAVQKTLKRPATKKEGEYDA